VLSGGHSINLSRYFSKPATAALKPSGDFTPVSSKAPAPSAGRRASRKQSKPPRWQRKTHQVECGRKATETFFTLRTPDLRTPSDPGGVEEKALGRIVLVWDGLYQGRQQRSTARQPVASEAVEPKRAFWFHGSQPQYNRELLKVDRPLW
jgi:hypothetical protein